MAPFKDTYKMAKRIAITVVGVSVLAIGIVMIVAPGPALVLIPVGLAILGLEFAWARLWLKRLRESISSRNMRGHGERAENHRRRLSR
jgi:tellurite resistance protein TerC